jgi:chromosomal replication initiation ATPase DnaA
VTRQLAFTLPPVQGLTRADFTVSEANYQALAAIESWRDWPTGRMIVVGPEGSGKTHLAHIWADLAGAAMIPANALEQADIAAASENAVVVEDCGTMTPAVQEALFHLHNLLAQNAQPLLITALQPPRDWGLTLLDLLSRMQAAPLCRLAEPDDRLLGAVLAKLFADRQVTIPPTLIPYLLLRMDRSLAAARALVEALDSASLARQVPVTRTLAAEVLDKP